MNNSDYINYFNIKLKWYQKIQIILTNKPYINCRNIGKMEINFLYMLEKLKRKTKNEEEKLYYESMQKEYSDICSNLKLGFWT